MGRFMIPCCCVCGKKAKSWNDSEWKKHDFCPKHNREFLFVGNKLVAVEDHAISLASNAERGKHGLLDRLLSGTT